MIDWTDWLEGYDDPTTLPARRLPVVRRLIAQALDEHAGPHAHVLSLCAGDGRDLLPLLVERQGKKRITARLVELTPALAERARAFAAEHGLEVEVLEGDAADPANYQVADVVLACGIFGNISDTDIRRTIGVLPALCREGGHVVWTRHRREPDVTPAIRRWFADAGLEERAFESPGVNDYAVGLNRRAQPIFTFRR